MCFDFLKLLLFTMQILADFENIEFQELILVCLPLLVLFIRKCAMNLILVGTIFSENAENH